MSDWFVYFLVYNVNLDEWCSRFDLEPFYPPCSTCGNILSVDVPFAAKGRRGLCANQCSCGNQFVPFSFVDLDFNENTLNALA